MNQILFYPPILFFICLLIVFIQYFLMGKMAPKAKKEPGKYKAYACGESSYLNRVQPEYQQFFTFAFFFTIMHVVALVVATIPTGFQASMLAELYIISAVVGLIILFKR